MIRAGAKKMGRLLDELLELSRIGHVVNPPEAVSLTDLAHEAASLVAGQIAERGVAVEIAPAIPMVAGDPMRLLVVLQNLLENAVKYMGDQPAPRIEIRATQDGEEVVCQVRDNGMGIDPRYHDTVFGLFEELVGLLATMQPMRHTTGAWQDDLLTLSTVVGVSSSMLDLVVSSP